MLSFTWPVIAGIGALIGKQENKIFDAIESDFLSFTIFMVLLLVVAIIAFRDLLKLSLMSYQVFTIKTYEKQLSNLIDNKAVFRNVDIWYSKFLKNHSKLYTTFTGITILTLLFIPTVVLYNLQSDSSYWVIYLLACILVYSTHFLALNFLLRKPVANMMND